MAKPRVIISTDIGGRDPDDMESMAHALLVSDQWDIKALISTPTTMAGRASHIHQAINAYAKDYADLKTWGNYATPEYLKSIVYQGSLKVPGSAGYSTANAGSKAIIKAAKDAKAAGEPLWVMAWGGLTDVAQALHDDPSIASTVRVLASNGSNWTRDPNSYNYVVNTHAKKGMWMIDSKSTHRGIYIDGTGKEGNPFNMSEVKGHGALGDYFYNARPWGVKMGDSWSIAYMTDGANNSNPGADSWGGTFVKNGKGANYWTDDPNGAYKIGSYLGAKHVREHQKQIYQDMYKQFDKAKAPKSGTTNTDDPVMAKNDAATTAKDKAVKISVLSNDVAPDGGLKVAGADGASAKGGKIAVNTDGTLTYTPKTGYTGNDGFYYTARDTDGDTGKAYVAVKVNATGSSTPSTSKPPAVAPSPEGNGGEVVANNNQYNLDAGKTLWFNTKYLTWNDIGADGQSGRNGALKVTALDKVSEQGVAVSWDANGTATYKAKPGYNGVDRLEYTVQDKDGNVGVGTVEIKVGKGTSSAISSADKPAPVPAPESKPGAGNPVVASDDVRVVQPDKPYYFNTRFLLSNDKGADGGLDVTRLDSVSKKGVKVSWGPEGSAADGMAVYKPIAGWKGVDSLNYTVTDANGSTDTGTVYLNVGNVDFLLA